MSRQNFFNCLYKRPQPKIQTNSLNSDFKRFASVIVQTVHSAERGIAYQNRFKYFSNVDLGFEYNVISCVLFALSKEDARRGCSEFKKRREIARDTFCVDVFKRGRNNLDYAT